MKIIIEIIKFHHTACNNLSLHLIAPANPQTATKINSTALIEYIAIDPTDASEFPLTDL